VYLYHWLKKKKKKKEKKKKEKKRKRKNGAMTRSEQQLAIGPRPNPPKQNVV
jgi:hypothetical protein